MSRQGFAALAVAALLVISGALYLSGQRNRSRDPHEAALLPSLAGEINTVTALRVRRGSATPTVTVHEQGGRWTVAERGDYPADVSKLRRLLLALSDAKIVEEKTSNPANFPTIGVGDPSLPGATGAEISVTAQDGKHTVIVGKPVGEGNFVRRGGENTSYSVEPGISFEAEPRYWIDSRLIDIKADNIQSIAVKPADGPAYVVHRNATIAKNSGAASSSAGSPGAQSFTLDGVPAGRQAADSATLAPTPSTYSGLTADDVTPVGSIDFSKATVATLALADGNVITLTGTTSGDKHWIQLQASKGGDLDAKLAGRAFDIAGYRYDAIFRPLEQLLVPKAPPAAKKGPGTVGSGNTAGRPPVPRKPLPPPAS